MAKGDNDWDLKAVILEKVKAAGGWVNAHAHLDRAHTIDLNSLELGEKHLHEKWELVDKIKQDSSVAQIYDRMAFGLERMLSQGVTAIGSFIDVDPVIKDKALKAAVKIKDKYQDQITIKIINQTLKGVLEPEARKWFEEGAEFADIIGGLPGKDAGKESQHLEVILDKGKKLNKPVHVHVDQLNTAKEKETELLVEKTLEAGMKGRVTAIHCISIAAHPKAYRQQLYQKMLEAGLMVVACPTGWIDHRRTEELVPSHNAVTPIDELIPAGITVALGTDNIADIYKPFTDGDMWTELRFLLESCHFYNLDQLAAIATKNGRRVLGL